MKALTRIVYSATFIFTTLILPTCFAASYEEIFQQFQTQNKDYSSHELMTTTYPGTKYKYFVAERGDVDGDGLDEIIFGMRKKGVEDKTTHRLVVLKGLKNKDFKVLLINQPMAEVNDFMTVRINEEGSFVVSSHFDGMVLSNAPGSTKDIEFGLSGEKMAIQRLSFSSPWRSESGSPQHSYTYNFDKSCYATDWEAIEDDYPVGKSETGKLNLKNNSSLYVDNTTDAFNTKDERDVIPVVLEGKISTTPDQSAILSRECY